MADLKQANVTITRAQSQFCQVSLNIMGYIYDLDSHYFDISKVLKIVDWQEYIYVTLARTFNGVYIYYQIWIKSFAQVVSPIYHVFKKIIPFIWKKEQVEAIDLIKLSLTTFPTLVSLDYSKRADNIILAINTSLEKWKGVLIQLVHGKRYLSRYESRIWFVIERKCNVTSGNIKRFSKLKEY